MKQLYTTLEIPVIAGLPDNEGHYLGIVRKYKDGDDAYFALYDIDSRSMISVLAGTSAEFWLSDENIDLPKAISCKGALITGDYIKYLEDDVEGYKITIYDSLTREEICCIEISEYVSGEWLTDYRVADAVCIDNKRVIIAAYNDSEYIGGAIELFTYFIESDELFSIGTYGAEDGVIDDDMGYLYDVRLAGDGRGLTCRRADDFDNIENPYYNEVWEDLKFTIDEDLRYFELFDRESMDPSVETFYELYNKQLAIKDKDGSILRDGYFKAGDVKSRTVLIDEIIGRKDAYETMFMPELNLFFVQILGDDRDAITYILGYDDENWIKIGSWTSDNEDFFILRYDPISKMAILENSQGSVLISRGA